MSDVRIVRNPNFPRGRRMEVACHDGSPCIDAICSCGYVMHVHETQVAMIPDDVEIAARCHRCGKPFVWNAGELQAALRESAAIARGEA